LLPPFVPPLCFFALLPPFPDVFGADCTGAGWDTGGDCTTPELEECDDDVPEEVEPLEALWTVEPWDEGVEARVIGATLWEVLVW
jgi:hypothetical protein